MNISIKDVMVLDDGNEYVVVSKINYQAELYYYLIDKNDPKNVKFCVAKEKTTLVDVVDEDLIKTLLPLFIEESKKIIENEK